MERFSFLDREERVRKVVGFVPFANDSNLFLEMASSPFYRSPFITK